MFSFYLYRYLKILKAKLQTICTSIIFSMMILIVIVEIHSKSSTLLLDTNNSDFNNINNYAIIQVPGLFIEQYHPLQQQINESYCNFNYALPNTFQFDYNVASNGTPEQGFTSPYRVLYNVISYSNNISILRKVPQITLCTHATPEFIPHFTELLRYWNGFISLTIFVPDFDAQVTLKHLKLLCYCLPEMYRVAVHFVYPLDAPPYINPNELQSPITECKVPQVFKSYRSIHSKIYPVNVGRNVARIGAKTRFVLVSDVELIPSFGLSEKFLGMIERIAAKTKRSEVVYDSSSTLSTMESDGNRDEVNRVLSSRYIFVVPVFEVELDEKVPRTKLLLQNMYAQDKAVYFHRWLCLHCQRFPGIQKWLSVVSNPDIVKPFLVVRREFPYHRWEPIFIGTNYDPLYSEDLSWEGLQDKMTQMLEMCFLKYRLVVLDNAFMVHTPGVKRRPSSQTVDNWRKPYQRNNSHSYTKILQTFAHKYNKNSKCHMQ